MKGPVFCIFFLAMATPMLAQECTERFHPLFDITTSEQLLTLHPGDEVWIEYSTDCFHIPQRNWGGEVRFGGQESFSAADVITSGEWFNVSRAPDDAIPGAVLGGDGDPLKIDSFLLHLDNGRVRSVAAVPHLIGKQTLDDSGLPNGGPVAAGEELVFNWYLQLSGPVGDAIVAALPEARLRTIEFTVGVPEPPGNAYAIQLAVMLFLVRRRRMR